VPGADDRRCGRGVWTCAFDLAAVLTPERARTIGERARRRILAEHTYDRPAAQVEDLLLNALEWKVRKSA
jgi:hypothetical protein